MKGRPPKTLEQRAADGDTRKIGRKKLAKQIESTVTPLMGMPPCPDHLTGDARWAWEFWSEQLDQMGVAYRCSGPLLEGACVAFARGRQADRIVAEQGPLSEDKILDKDGSVVTLKQRKHPAVTISERAWLTVKAFMEKFGMSPVDRARISTVEGLKPPASNIGSQDIKQMIAARSTSFTYKPKDIQ